jgi:hypothetical protein
VNPPLPTHHVPVALHPRHGAVGLPRRGVLPVAIGIRVLRRLPVRAGPEPAAAKLVRRDRLGARVLRGAAGRVVRRDRARCAGSCAAVLRKLLLLLHRLILLALRVERGLLLRVHLVPARVSVRGRRLRRVRRRVPGSARMPLLLPLLLLLLLLLLILLLLILLVLLLVLRLLLCLLRREPLLLLPLLLLPLLLLLLLPLEARRVDARDAVGHLEDGRRRARRVESRKHCDRHEVVGRDDLFVRHVGVLGLKELVPGVAQRAPFRLHHGVNV